MGAVILTHRWGRELKRGVIHIFVAVGCLAAAALGQVHVVDGIGDAAVRRTDLGADGPVDTRLHRMPDVKSYTIGTWEPQKPEDDLFKGDWDSRGRFVRLDVVFDGLLNPPGLVGENFLPFQHGPHPVFGYIEIDMDADVDTGGEFDPNNELQPGDAPLRYTGAVARYGGHPTGPAFVDRIAPGAAAFDGVLATPPYVDRGGEEFHVALHGWQIDSFDMRKCRGQCDGIFEVGEIWVATGQLFHRAHAYEPFSFAKPDRTYEPRDVQLMFEHSIPNDETTVSLVYPLTNAGSAAMRGEQEQPNNNDARDQNSVLEGLDDLSFSARNAPPEWRNDDNFPIIEAWEFKDPSDYLDPRTWRVSIVVATSYYEEVEVGAYFVWTDHYPNVKSGDFNGDNEVNNADNDACCAFIAAVDGDGKEDCDGEVNERVELCRFGPNFSLYDMNYDGMVDDLDCSCSSCLDLADAAHFQRCFTGPGGGPLPQHCLAMDFDGDDDVDLSDHGRFVPRFCGP
ncbi:MAG: hypothetical protein C4547_11145 [Phycisphaerales bacterium]|nr:MAG: hypothetical protein C4547_11145 [Phycisphaerales bacterium]